MTADPTGTWTFAQTDLNIAQVVYDNDVWVSLGRPDGTTQLGISTATEPAGTWTRKQTLTSIDANGASRLIHADGRWAFVRGAKIYHSTDNWATYTETTPTFQGSTNIQSLGSIAYGEGYWVVNRQTPNSGNFTYELQYATSLTGTWTKIAGGADLAGGIPLIVAYNGTAWVAAGWSAYQAPALGPVFVRASSLTGTWTAPTNNRTTTSQFTLLYPTSLRWLPEINEWVCGVSGGSSVATPYYAAADGNGWLETGLLSGLFSNGVRAAGDGYVVAFGQNPGNPQRMGYVLAESLASTTTGTVVTDATTNTSGLTTTTSLSDITYGDGFFVLAGRPSTQSYYGVAVSQGGPDDGAGWGMLL